MYLVYVLRCGDGTLYTGIATDVKRRLAEHRAGTGARYTRGRGPFRIVYTEKRQDRSSALKRELFIKKQTRAGKLRLIRGR